MPPVAFEPHRFGAYTLEARLGHGGMAEVFRATREGVAGFERECVVKRILGHHNEDPSFVDMFINEAKIAAKLTHPNIVQVYELGQVDGEFFIAMEYVKGRDLLRVLRELAQTRGEDPAVPAPIAAYVAREVCRGLQHAHDHTDDRGTLRPIIHRDVSPQNVMLTYDGQVKLVDFGIAKALGAVRDETRTGGLKGKFAYMAPEQVDAQSPGSSADIFAIGVVLHEMLTGRRLFKGANDFETLTKVRSMEVPTPSSIDPRLPAELDAIVMKALDRDRTRRYERAGQMARDLDGYLQTVRFSVEEMSDFMRALFPPAAVDSAEHRTAEYALPVEGSGASGRSSSGVGSSLRSTPLGELSNRSSVRSQSQLPAREITATGTGGRRTLVLAGALALGVGTGAILLVTRHPPTRVPTVEAVGAGLPLGPEVIQLPPETRTVHLQSEPSGARVYEGPRLVGETPLDLRLAVDAPGMSVTLVHEQRADLTYVVRPADAPALTLRMSTPSSDIAPTPLKLQHGPHPGKVRPHDDVPQHTRPKIEPLDD